MRNTVLFLVLAAALAGCSTYQPLTSPCQEDAFGKTRINQW